MHSVFGFFVLLFFILRAVARLVRRGTSRGDSNRRVQEAFQDLVRQYGGDTYRNGRRKLLYVSQDRSVELQIDSNSSRLVLRLRKAVSGRFSFYRLPRLVYAFLEAFLESRYRLEHTHYLIGSNSSEMLTKFQTRHGFVPLMQKLDALVGDGHSNVSPWRDSTALFHELPVALYWFEDGLYVRAASKAQRALVGAKVLGIGGVSTEQAVERVRPLISRDNEMGVRAWAPILLTMPEVLHAVGLSSDPARAVFDLEAGGKRREVALVPVGPYPMLTGDTDRTWSKRSDWVDARDAAPDPLWLRDPGDKYWYRVLPERRALYCQINAIQQKAGDSLRAFLARAVHAADSARVERFVLDLRLNGGGDGYWNRDILRSLIKSRYDEPGRLLVITGRRTWSAAQMLLNELENWSDAVFVGEPSAMCRHQDRKR